jgi:hypothetical protein
LVARRKTLRRSLGIERDAGGALLFGAGVLAIYATAIFLACTACLLAK